MTVPDPAPADARRTENSLAVIRAYVEGQAALGYVDFDPTPASDDVILATFPKSGSTWTSYLLHQIRSDCDEDFDDIKNMVVDITPGHWDPRRQPFAEAQAFRPRTYKTHGSAARAPRGGRVIYVTRSPQDIFVSLYHFIHDLLGLDALVPMDRFYRDYFVARFDSGHDIGNVWDHLLGWHARRETEQLLWLAYEDLVRDREAAIAAIARHMGVALNATALARVIEHSAMDHMRKIADKINPSPNNYVGRIVADFGELTRGYARHMKVGKLRRGEPGDGRRDLPRELIDEMDREWRQRITPHLGYGDYAAMRAACSSLR